MALVQAYELSTVPIKLRKVPGNHAVFGGGETKVARILYTTWNDRIRVVETAFRHPTAFATGLTCGEGKLFTSVSILPTVG
jgi:hypothetical protein